MHEQQNQETLDLHAYLRPIWRRKWIILAIVVVATAATYFVASHQKKSYVASTKLYVETADPTQSISNSGAQAPPTTQSIADVAQLVTAQSVTNSVARTLRVTPTSAANAVTATPSTDSDFVTVTATSHSPKLAARLANTYASAFLTSRQQAVSAEALRDASAAQATLETTSDTAQRQTILQQIATYRQIAINPSPGARRINTAAVPTLPASPKPLRDAIFAGVIGLVLAVIVAFCLELLDRRLLRISAVESAYDRPVLAVLPHVADPAPLAERGHPAVPPQFLEELRSLRVMVRLGDKSEPPRTIIVTSALPKEGKSTIVRDLSLVYAESGERVLVIDGDLRRPSMEGLFGFEAETGLVQVLQGGSTLSEAVHPVVAPPQTEPVWITSRAQGSRNGTSRNGTSRNGTSRNGTSRNGSSSRGPRLDVLAHGELVDNPLALLSSERMTTLLAEALESYDIVLVDTPPVLTVADSVPLLEVVDSVLVVTRLGQTTRRSADRFTDLIDRLSDVKFTGVIANDRRESDNEGYGSYGQYGYGYYSGPKRGKRETAGTTAS